MRKIISLVGLVSGMLLLSGFAFAGDTVGGSVSVMSTCSVGVTPGIVDFGQLLPGTNNVPSNPSTVSVTLTTNANVTTPSNVTISGTGWTGQGSTPPTMSVGLTRYNNNGGSFLNLTSSQVLLFSGAAGEPAHTVALELSVPGTQTASAYTQTITFGFSC